jgi:hypothetical protein
MERVQPRQIGEAEWNQLVHDLAPISDNYLRRLLRESEAALAPLIEGVRQESFDALEASLTSLASEYEHSSAERRASIRALVITAKDHARWALRRDPQRTGKEEMKLWMLTWLENPPLFPEWIRIRRERLSDAG